MWSEEHIILLDACTLEEIDRRLLRHLRPLTHESILTTPMAFDLRAFEHHILLAAAQPQNPQYRISVQTRREE